MKTRTLLSMVALASMFGLAGAVNAQGLKSKDDHKGHSHPSATDDAPGKDKANDKAKGTAKTGDMQMAKVGKPAPAFTLKDASGKEHSLSDYEGKIVVLQWINPKCPVCVRCASTGIVSKMREQLEEMDVDVVHLAINSTHFIDISTATAYLKEHDLGAVLTLDDQDGKVGHLYAARTTPHMFVIDQKGILRYSGAIDDDERGKSDSPTNYVVNAVSQIAAGETVSPDQTKPYGCSVKYKKK